MRTVLEPLFAARTLSPALPETYQLIAEAWTLSEVKPTREHLLVLDEGVEKFPAKPVLVRATAEAFHGAGFKVEARLLADLGTALTRDPEALKSFERILANGEGAMPAR